MKNFRYKKCFIINRGEVLKRISSTLKKMGIQSVAISDGSNFMKENVDILLDEESDISSYLDRKKILRIAKKNGIDMIHPGYGFLSEDSEFAYNVVSNNMVWIGPNHLAMMILSNKLTSKKWAQQAGVPVIKSSSDFRPNKDLDKINSPSEFSPTKDIEEIKSLIKDFKYPLIIKSIFSGGGKGIRIVKKEEDLKFLIDQCAKESERYFPNSLLIIEEYLEGFSHIEVQVIMDRSGNGFVLGTRECSIQRRNQKILEQAPASISESIFKKLRQYSLDLIQGCGFDSISTIEFLVNKKTEEIYFMEINPRLQVEHGVTESIYDLDLVELQIKIAHDFNFKDDKELFNKLKEIDSTNKASKSSIEVRLCSETPFSFLPCPGRKKISPVFYKDHIRWDNGVEFDKDIEVEGGFDSLLTKVIVTASSRDEVIDIFNKQLFPSVKIEGVTNWDLFKSIFKEKDFIDNNINTQYLSTHIEKLEELNTTNDKEQDKNTKIAVDKKTKSTINENSYHPSLEEITRFAFSSNQTFSIDTRNYVYTTHINSDSSYKPAIIKDLVSLNTDNTTNNSSDNKVSSTYSKKPLGLNCIYPPVPGKVLSLNVKKGDIVNKNDIVCTIESMKMEIEVVSEYSGKIESITDSSWVNTSDAVVTVSSISN